MSKKERTPEQIETDRERMARARAARTQKAVNDSPDQAIDVKRDVPKVTLDLTNEQVDVETQLVQYILWEFDQGRNPTEIKVTPSQAVNIANFTRIKPVRMYQSPFGNHNIHIVTAKERDNEEAA